MKSWISKSQPSFWLKKQQQKTCCMISKGLPQQVLIQHLKTAVSSLTDTRPRGYKNFGNSYSCFAQEKKKNQYIWLYLYKNIKQTVSLMSMLRSWCLNNWVQEVFFCLPKLYPNKWWLCHERTNKLSDNQLFRLICVFAGCKRITFSPAYGGGFMESLTKSHNIAVLVQINLLDKLSNQILRSLHKPSD